MFPFLLFMFWNLTCLFSSSEIYGAFISTLHLSPSKTQPLISCKSCLAVKLYCEEAASAANAAAVAI